VATADPNDQMRELWDILGKLGVPKSLTQEDPTFQAPLPLSPSGRFEDMRSEGNDLLQQYLARFIRGLQVVR
jgi:hypothetical protein